MWDVQRQQGRVHHRQRPQGHMGVHMPHMRHPQEAVIGRITGRGHAKANALDRHAPERIATDGGKMAKIDYTRPEEPSVAVFIQQLYSQRDTPKIAGGRVPLVLSILAPNHRPIQVTRDLAGFWKNHYPAIKKEMERRYPRHEWRAM